MKSAYTWDELLEIFELKPEQAVMPHRSMGVSEANQALAKAKEVFRKQRRKLAKKYHPDRPGGNLEKLQLINAILDQIEKIKIVPRPRPAFQFSWTNVTTGSATYDSGNYSYYTWRSF